VVVSSLTRIRESKYCWVCSVCGLDQTEEVDLVIHLARVHKYCYDCEVQFVDYQEHCVRRHGRRSQCNRGFKTSYEIAEVQGLGWSDDFILNLIPTASEGFLDDTVACNCGLPTSPRLRIARLLGAKAKRSLVYALLNHVSSDPPWPRISN
jgi:hypothetical protein